jgi:hypothetical protein
LVRFVCTITAQRKAYPEMSGPGRRSVLVAVTVCPVVGIDGDGDGQHPPPK